MRSPSHSSAIALTGANASVLCVSSPRASVVAVVFALTGANASVLSVSHPSTQPEQAAASRP
eukprot:14722145-Heterocapsa_arctica.AAC.1